MAVLLENYHIPLLSTASPPEYNLLQLKMLSPVIVLADESRLYMTLCASSSKTKAVRALEGIFQRTDIERTTSSLLVRCFISYLGPSLIFEFGFSRQDLHLGSFAKLKSALRNPFDPQVVGLRA